MTNDQALLASMENNTIIVVFIIVLIIWYLMYVFGKDSKPKKYLVHKDDIAEDNQYINKNKLIDILYKFYVSDTNRYELKEYSTYDSNRDIIQKWVEENVFNQETK